MDEQHHQQNLLASNNKTEVIDQQNQQLVVGGGGGTGGGVLQQQHDENDDENGDQTIQRTQLVATTSDGRNHVVSVPVSVGSLLGTAFNVITPDQLPHFKQMLCVDSNGFLSGNTVVSDSGDMKTTHYVIHQQPANNEQQQVNNVAQLQQQQQLQLQQQQQQLMQHQQEENSPGTPSDQEHQQDQNHASITGQMSAQAWETTNNLAVLSIRCKSTTADLYKAKLGSGGRGRCVKYKDQWFTPSEFENVCGRGSSKDWKRSIRYGGRSLQALIDEGILLPHATSCTCAACCDDDTTASGPVRLFTPYKRRRRNQITPDSSSTRIQANNNHNTTTNVNHTSPAVIAAAGVAAPVSKQRRINEIEESSETEQNNSNLVNAKNEPTWQTLAESLDVVSQDYLDATSSTTSQMIAEANLPLDRLTTLCAQMTKATNDFRRAINEAKELHIRQIEKLQQERDAALLAARVHEEMEDPNSMSNQIPGMEMPAAKKCANCNREAMAECSLCRRTPYCSTFCQRKDWNAHQVECTREPTEGAIMVLVEDP